MQLYLRGSLNGLNVAGALRLVILLPTHSVEEEENKRANNGSRPLQQMK